MKSLWFLVITLVGSIFTSSYRSGLRMCSITAIGLIWCRWIQFSFFTNLIFFGLFIVFFRFQWWFKCATFLSLFWMKKNYSKILLVFNKQKLTQIAHVDSTYLLTHDSLSVEYSVCLVSSLNSSSVNVNFVDSSVLTYWFAFCCDCKCNAAWTPFTSACDRRVASLDLSAFFPLPPSLLMEKLTFQLISNKLQFEFEPTIVRWIWCGIRCWNWTWFAAIFLLWRRCITLTIVRTVRQCILQPNIEQIL